MAIEIEEVTDLDAVWPELRALFLEFDEYSQRFQPRELREDWEERLRDRLRLHDDRLVLLARQHGVAVGQLVGVVLRDDELGLDVHGYLSFAFIQPEFRRAGAGRALLARAEKWCVLRGASRVELEVYTGNKLGEAFWNNAGFKPVSTTMSKMLEAAIR